MSTHAALQSKNVVSAIMQFCNAAQWTQMLEVSRVFHAAEPSDAKWDREFTRVFKQPPMKRHPGKAGVMKRLRGKNTYQCSDCGAFECGKPVKAESDHFDRPLCRDCARKPEFRLINLGEAAQLAGVTPKRLKNNLPFTGSRVHGWRFSLVRVMEWAGIEPAAKRRRVASPEEN